MVDKVNRAIAQFGDLAPFLDDHVLRGVVVLGDFVAGDEGIDDQDVDLFVDDLLNQGVDHRPHDHGAVPGHCRDDERLVAPAVHEQAVSDGPGPQTIVLRYRLYLALGFFLRILKVPEPDAQALLGVDPDQVHAGNLRDGLCGDQRRLAEPARSHGGGDELPDQQPPVEPVPWRDIGWLDPFVG